MGYAAVSQDKTYQLSLPNNASVFTAELYGIASAIKIIKETSFNNFVIFSNSRSTIEAIQSYKSKNNIVQQIKLYLHNLCNNGKNVEMSWIPAHVGIKGNEDADKAATEATHMTRSNVNIPVTDYVTDIKMGIINKWQYIWNKEPESNKLKQIKPNIKRQSSSYQRRHAQVILTRLRIGHTRLTHGHLMSSPHGQAPE